MTDPTPENGTRRTELRKRRESRRRITVISVLVLLIVAVGGVFVATRDTGSSGAAAPTPTRSLTQAGAGLSTSFGVAPMRAATTKGGDLAVYATPDAAAQPTTTLSAQTEYTLPRTVLAFDQHQDWLHVYLP